MSKAKWIWLKGDFELYHSIQLHSKREERGFDYPPMWALSSPYPDVNFVTRFTAETEFELTVKARGKGYIELNRVRYNIGSTITVKPGEYQVRVAVIAPNGGFPSIFIDSEYLKTDETWLCHRTGAKRFPVGASPEYLSENDNPEIFKFAYEDIFPVSRRLTERGVLLDYGKETFGPVTVKNADPDAVYRLCYGESEEEAQNDIYAIIQRTLTGASEYSLDGRAFRYLHLTGDGADKLTVSAQYEYLPLTDRASFSCDNPEIKRIWDICAYTFHLNSREFFLDGIKRDRWVWSGDAYQSYMANNYLYFDPEITKRTITALLGKPPYEQHINNINDYSMYLIIAVSEYYRNTGDLAFVEFILPRLSALYDFIASRTDEEDFICYRQGDWIFIDWSDMDKDGNLCAEQILYWRTKLAMAELTELMGDSGDAYRREAATLKRKILKHFWREEKGAFIDCYSTGKENVTRHANIFAILYDFVGRSRAKTILKNVLENDSITHITTPYFEFFELLAYGKMGKLRHIQDKIESYWGGIVSLGATSIWEQYIPERKGVEHYEMYGDKFGCSLCHAWGSGPIYLLGRYCLGVYPTDIGYKTFRVEPNPGKYESFEGSVPLPKGEVFVKYKGGKLSVTASAEGGTLQWRGKEYVLEKNTELTV